jgi:two-component system, OmpR family, response regulator
MTQGEQPPRILVVTDELDVGGHIQDSLTLHGCEVTTAATGKDALRQAGSADHDLIVLDAALPDLDGLEVGRRLRASGDSTPVVWLADPGTHMEGAEDVDHYMTKPFSADALTARVLAVIGRADRPAAGERETGTRLHAGDLELDESRWTVHRAGTPVELSPTEFRLLIYLMTNQGRMLSREQILENVWGRARRTQIVDTYVSYLRRKLDSLGPPLIHTQRGVGYGLQPDPMPSGD